MAGWLRIQPLRRQGIFNTGASRTKRITHPFLSLLPRCLCALTSALAHFDLPLSKIMFKKDKRFNRWRYTTDKRMRNVLFGSKNQSLPHTHTFFCYRESVQHPQGFNFSRGSQCHTCIITPRAAHFCGGFRKHPLGARGRAIPFLFKKKGAISLRRTRLTCSYPQVLLGVFSFLQAVALWL